MITLSLVPVSLGDRSNPDAAGRRQARLSASVWRISPLGCIGCIAVGVTNSAFRTLSPVYAEEIGMSVADVVTFVSVSIIGGAIIQYPLGYLSDRWDRRMVLLLSDQRRAAFRARHRLPRRHQPPGQLRPGLHLRLVRDAAVFAVGRACQRPRRQGRVRAGQRRADAVLFVRRDRRPDRRVLGHAAFRAAVAVHLQRRPSTPIFIVIILYRMSVARQRAGRPARPLHGAAEDLDDVCPLGQRNGDSDKPSSKP